MTTALFPIGHGTSLMLALMLAGCSAPEDKAASAGTDQAAAPAAPASPDAPSAPAPGATNFTDNEDEGEAKREFSYSWPAKVAAIPALTQRLTAERDKLLAEQKAEWQESLREFGDSDCIACVNRDLQKSWDVVADVPRFLSLSWELYAYTGGAHGNSGSGGLVWDREANVALAPKDLFVSEAALQDALYTRWCKALQRDRVTRLGMEPADSSTFPCPQIAELTVLLGSSNKTHFDRVGLIADPYVAGSYAEGSYELTFPVTAEVLAAVKPEYKAAFALGK